MNEDEDLIKSIDHLTRATRRSNSIGWGFLHGLAAAIGGAIGLTILITVAVYISSKVPETNIVGKVFHAIAIIVNRNQH